MTFVDEVEVEAARRQVIRNALKQAGGTVVWLRVTPSPDGKDALHPPADSPMVMVGNTQNGDGNEYSAIVAIENAAMASTRLLPAAMLARSAIPTMNSGTAACQRRSPVRSDDQPISKIPTRLTQ